MKCLILLICFAYCFQAKGQDNKEVQFVKGITLEDAKRIAEAEGKYLLIDCYTTWCKPCRLMDSLVYKNEAVAKFVNSNYISIKLQMDTSKYDNSDIQKVYSSAKRVFDEYDINAFPTFLFFNPSGEIVHRAVGFKNPSDFYTLASESLLPNNQYYGILKRYELNEVDASQIKYLARSAKLFGDTTTANRIAGSYIGRMNSASFNDGDDLSFLKQFINLAIAKGKINSYMESVSGLQLFERRNLQLMRELTTQSDDFGFKFFLKHGKQIDSLLDFPGYASGLVRYIIAKEDFDSFLWKGDNVITEKPNWKEMWNRIALKYDQKHADAVIIEGKIRWYNYKKNWKELAKAHIQKIDKYGLDTSGFNKYLNNNIFWEVFVLHIEEKKMLNKGIEYMRIVMSATKAPIEMDTYANLLYKAGRVTEAIYWQKIAIKKEKESAESQKRKIDSSFQENLKKMELGDKTWM